MNSSVRNQSRRKRVLLLLGWYAPRTEEGIVRFAREAGWSLDLQTIRTGSFPEHEGLDGILSILGGWGTRPDFTDFVRQSVGVPVVDMHADEAATLPAGRVLADNLAVGRLAAEHFLERGFKHALFCCKNLSDWSVAERELGFRSHLEENGVISSAFAYDNNDNTREFKAGDCVIQLTRHLATAQYPLAVFAANDDFALLVLDACLQAGLKIPEEVALLGCDNDPLVVEFANIPLSSVDPNFITRSYQAAQLLDRLMAGETIPAEPIRIKPTGVFVRRSTDILAVDDPHVAAALNVIRRRFAEVALGPLDVADACGVNLRTLNRSILKHLGRSVAEDIRQVRLRHARNLLSTTELNISEIAEQSGFSNLLHLRRSLKRDSGISPRRWRAAQANAQTAL